MKLSDLFKKRHGNKCGGGCELAHPHDGTKHGYVFSISRVRGKVTGHSISHWGEGDIPKLHQMTFSDMNIEDKTA